MHYTNNTGWVDFITTPTVGMLWVLAEDTLDRYISDCIQGTDQIYMLLKIVRGSVNPSRTFAAARVAIFSPTLRALVTTVLARLVQPSPCFWLTPLS